MTTPENRVRRGDCIFDAILALVREAESNGFDVLVDHVAQEPLAMGNHHHRIRVIDNNATYRKEMNK